MKSHNKLLCKSRCFLRASPLSPRGLVCLAEEARFGQAWLLPVSGPLPTQTNDEADSGSAPLRDRSRPWMCLQRKRQAVTLPRAIYKPFWMNWAILGLLSLHHSQPLLHLLSHFLVCSLSFVLFLLSGFPSAVFVTYSSETNALFIPPPGVGIPHFLWLGTGGQE